MRVAYADPPYPGQAHLYRGHPDYAGEVDHAALAAQLEAEYDAWVLHTSSTALAHVLACFELPHAGLRVLAWVKPFASWKPNIRVPYAWEPVIVKPARPRRRDQYSVPDYLAEPITLKKGLTGAKPQAVCEWIFEVLNLEPADELVDLFPGTGAVMTAWEHWCSSPRLPLDAGSPGSRPDQAGLPLDG